jgi:hypothetical protein
MPAAAFFTRENYDKLLAAYRESPGNHSHAHRKTGITRPACRLAYDRGWVKRAGEWARPIREVIEEEIEAARSKVEALERAEKFGEAERERVRQASIAQRVKLGETVQLATANARGLLGITAGLFKNAARLVEKVQEAALDPNLRPDVALNLLRHTGKLAKDATVVAREALEMDKLYRGEPTVIVGTADLPKEFSLEEATKRVEAARRAVERAQARAASGLTVIEGGGGEPKAGTGG